MESILKSLWFVFSKPPSVAPDLTPFSVEYLNRLRGELIPFRDADLHLLVWATILVTIGVVMEVAEIQHDVREAVSKLKCQFSKVKRRRRVGELGPVWKLVVAIGWVLVAFGLGLEWLGDARVNSVSSDLDRINQVIVDRTQGEAIAAENAAGKAEISAQGASIAAGKAQSKANLADTAAGRANRVATAAENGLQVSLQRTKRLEGQLSWRTITPEQKKRLRSLLSLYTKELLPLSGLKIGITYVNQNPEAEEYAEELKNALDRLGAEISAPSGVVLFGAPGSKPLEGLIVEGNPYRNPRATMLLNAIHNAGISVSGKRQDSLGDRTISITVGAKPRDSIPKQ